MLKKIILIIAGLAVGVLARENPFLPAKSFEGVDAPTNKIEKRGDFEQQATSLPSRARVLKYVVFGYQSLDGNIEEKRMEIDKDIDWHDPLVVTKESSLLNFPLILPKLPPGEDAPLMTNLDKKDEILKDEMPIEAEEKSVKATHEELISFEAFKMRMEIETKDDLIRHFMVVDPYKVVLDFENDTSFYTKEIDIEYGAFKSVTLGNHKGYYRSAILLDGHYIYEINKIDGGYEVILK